MQKIRSVSDNVEKKEICTLYGNVNWYSHHNKQLPYDPNPTYGYIPKRIEIRILERYLSSVFIVGSLTIAKIWKHPKYILMDEWINKM